ncbi:hypothetical protein ACFSQT_33005 [Mesorhizobium calcicola]|uniref:Uncharacterized protein n=1 Tax=Mesorhizobium calcicola TaxID=1300310 RepID=A0ABW4WQ86_9HYPH
MAFGSTGVGLLPFKPRTDNSAVRGCQVDQNRVAARASFLVFETLKADDVHAISERIDDARRDAARVQAQAKHV